MFTVKTVDGRIVSIVARHIETLIADNEQSPFTTIVMSSGASYKVEIGSREIAKRMVPGMQ